jgi:hypothetical protein
MPSRAGVSFRSAMLGFAITAAFVSYQLVTDPESPISRNSAVMRLFVILCPPSLLSLPFLDAEAGSSGFYLVWAVIGLLNAALYASVRALISGRFKKAD